MFKLSASQAKYYEVLQRASSFLSKNQLPPFAAERFMQERLSWSKTDLINHYREIMPIKEKKQFEQDINQFYEGKPLQQIIGHEWFHHRKFLVNEHTLIPRPETEDWMDRVLKLLPNQPLNVLDLGTGTGVLAITHKLERPADQVIASDISVEALKVAEKNAQRLGAEIQFVASDLFHELQEETFDIILSNPPYISQKEINLMDESVLKYEPKQALFAQNDGLAVYEKMAQQISVHLNESYGVFLEIGYTQGNRVVEIFRTVLPTARIDIWQDFNGLDRVVAIRNGNCG